MKRIVIDTPVPVFVLGLFLPLILAYSEFSFPPAISIVLQLVPSITLVLWVLSVTEFVKDETGSNRFVILIYAMEVIRMVFAVDYTFNLDLLEKLYLPNYIRLLIFNGIVGIVLALNVKKLFTERTLWWIILEIAFPLIGVWTLTSEIQRYEKSKTEITDDDILDS